MNKRDYNDSQIIMVTEKLRLWAKRKVLPHQVEDFVQSCAVLWFEGRDIRTDFNFLLADWLRENGSYTREGNTPKDALRSAMYDQKHGTAFMFADFKSTDPADHVHDPRVNAFLKKLPQIKRAVVILKFSWSLTSREIAHVLGVSEQRICQMLAELRVKK